jgi:hypothetical protein
VGNSQGGGGHGGKGGGKGGHTVTIKYIQLTIAALGAIFDKLNIPDDDSDDTSEDE